MADHDPVRQFGFTFRIIKDDWGLTPKHPTLRNRDDEEDLTLGFSMLRALAEAGDPMVEIGPGVWRDSGEGVTWVPKLDLPRHEPGE